MAKDRAVFSDSAGRVGRQIVLPWSKAFEISLKTLRIRFWRSVVTMASIILAIAFLMSILTNNAIEKSLRRADRDEGAFKAKLAELSARKQGATNEQQLRALDKQIAKLERKLSGLAALRITLQRKGILLAEAEESGEQERIVKEEVRASAILRTLGLEEITSKQWWLIILALLVCAVGIVNAMLMSVTERFREIGTMKCLGALDSFVIKLFLIESAVQGMTGTLLGIILGLMLTLLWSLISFKTWVIDYFPGTAVLKFALLSFLLGSFLSVAGAVAPALKAANMQPVDAMRVEE